MRCIRSARFQRGCRTAFLGIVLIGAALPPARCSAQNTTLKPEELAAQVINAANKAYNEKQYPVAIERYREYLKTHGNQKDATLARYGLALCLLEQPQKDFKVAIETLNPVVGVQEFADRPLALYYLALAYRGQGHDALAQAIAKPNEAVQHRNTAKDHFTQANTRFGEAITAFLARAKTAPPPAANGTIILIGWLG